MLCFEKQSGLVLEELSSVGRCHVHVSYAQTENVSAPAGREFTVSLASMRLDALLAEMIHTSRSNAVKLDSRRRGRDQSHTEHQAPMNPFMKETRSAFGVMESFVCKKLENRVGKAEHLYPIYNIDRGQSLMNADDIRNVTFDKVMRGYRSEEVDAYLEQVAAEMEKLQAEKKRTMRKTLYPGGEG